MGIIDTTFLLLHGPATMSQTPPRPRDKHGNQNKAILAKDDRRIQHPSAVEFPIFLNLPAHLSTFTISFSTHERLV